MGVIDFYKRVVTNVGLHVDDAGFIWNSNKSDKKAMVMADGKPLVMPTQEHINSIYQKDEDDEDGNIILTKLPYNPLNENIVKGDSLSLSRTRAFVSVRLSHIIASLGELLLISASDSKLQVKDNITLCQFYSLVNKAKNEHIKVVIDKNTIDNWGKLYAAILKESKTMVNVYIARDKVYGGTKYHRLSTMDIPLYSELLKADKNTEVMGIKLRNKDLIMFRELFKFMLPELDDNGVISIGSNDNEAPGFVSLMSLFTTVVSRTNPMIKELNFVNQELVESVYVNDLIEEKELTRESLSTFDKDLMAIPSDTDLNRTAVKMNMSNAKSGILGSVPDYNQGATTPSVLPTAVTPSPSSGYPATPVAYGSVDTIDDPVERALRLNNVNAPMNMTQSFASMQPTPSYPPMGMNPVMGNNGFSQPMGMPMNNMNMGMSIQPSTYQGFPNMSNPSSYYDNGGFNGMSNVGAPLSMGFANRRPM